MRFRFTPALVLTLAVGWVSAPAAPVPKKKTTLEDKLVGTWRLVREKGENPGYTLYVEYKAGGVLEVRYEYAGDLLPKETYTGTYKAIEPDDANPLGSIDWTIDEPTGPRSEVAKVSTLTADELTEVDPKGKAERFERVKQAAKDK